MEEIINYKDLLERLLVKFYIDGYGEDCERIEWSYNEGYGLGKDYELEKELLPILKKLEKE